MAMWKDGKDLGELATVARRLLPALSRFRGLPSLPSEGWPSVLRQLPSPHTPRAVDAIPPNLTA
ncbi:hypothetical protein QC761_0033980 [Podospora bellae-mahoneyi]|uniref:Uncharacterized protein n=1 Tax=Podospora bellae-mahoneyi TaxID=2093777 RepID=A0ABR0FRH1_9PEZI|nr:hypothetical protein QC761_0033980 [Podospora bellae-mahoneyi]